ncbi:MAG: glycerol-3-phosphate dehydrogenase [Deltaproteobacteria bacterium GWC2_42_11]|nr:MAG: glycerol-3-phosphate dehydrogenase [Deltaproteobacteria bacterium GWC2_42_11]HBO84368.1 NAD(P)H-dependent glycerol-3-phosphate dehydrogenase [Deltaproteobacteria bacterium]
MEEIGIIGAGSWGTTLANLIAEKGYNVSLWVRRDDLCQKIKKIGENPDYLPGIKLSGNIQPTTLMEHAVKEKTFIVCALPSHHVRSVVQSAKHLFSPNTLILSASKGIEDDTLLTVSGIFKTILPEVMHKNIAVLSGPSFAKEVCLKLPTAVCIAGEKKEVSERFQGLFGTEYFRVYTNSDVAGVELGGALKNVIAIAAGICDGLGLGNNARAALMTRGLAEITRLGGKLGANPLTFSGLSGLGDMVLTCTGKLSRNRYVGSMIGKGFGLDEILKNMKMVAEGVRTTMAAYELSKRHGVPMPITEQVYNILYKNKDARDAVYKLMTREQKGE